LKPTGQPTTLEPTISSKPTQLCVDNVTWIDYFGDNCEWYETHDEPGCPNYGNTSEDDSIWGSAHDNCCYCGGSSSASAPTQSTTRVRVQVVTPDSFLFDWYPFANNLTPNRGHLTFELKASRAAHIALGSSSYSPI